MGCGGYSTARGVAGRTNEPREHAIISSESSLKYRRDIDGLRAVAVLSVLIYHAYPAWLPGGFIGVDIFFVISGFLITTIILGSFQGDGFSYRDFYARRIKRIFPALLLVLASTCVVGWFILLPHDLAQLGKHVAAGAGFVSNIAFWREAGYFDAAAETKPLLHLWSLAVEEQFYVLWPLLLGLAVRLRWNVGVVVGVVAAASFGINVLTVQADPTAAFYSPASRFWELMIGGLLACECLRRRGPPSGIVAHARSIAGAVLVVSGLFVIRGTGAFPGWWALLPTLGAYLCISAGPDGILNRTLLASRPMVWIGLISYPLYLWHWPLLVFARWLELDENHGTVPALALGLSVVLAHGTYRLLERPIRRGAEHQRSRIIGLTVSMALICTVGIAAKLSNGFGFRLQGTPLAFASHDYDFASDAMVGTCWVGAAEAPDAYAGECAGESDSRPILIWGDSHAGRFAPGLRLELGPGVPIAEYARDGCPGIVGFGYPSCIDANAHVVEQIKRIRPRTVILFGSWTFYLPPVWNLKANDLQHTVDLLKAAGVSRIVVMGPAPKWKNALPVVLSTVHRQDRSALLPSRTAFGLAPEAARADHDLSTMSAGVSGVSYFSTYESMCDSMGCLTYLTNSPEGLTSWDYGHLTTSGARFVARRLIDQFPAIAQP